MKTTRPGMDRRAFVAGLAMLALVPSAPASAHAGALDAVEAGLRPGVEEDQGATLAAILREAGVRGLPVFVPPGRYLVSDVALPEHAVLLGVPGLSRLVMGAGRHMLAADDARTVYIDGLVLDGRHRALASGVVSGLVTLRGVRDLVIDRCSVLDSGATGIALEGCAGRVERCTLAGAVDYGIYSVESDGVAVHGNRVADCGNGGILVHRWQAGADGSSVTGNRVERIGASDGGTGQYGNGINVYQAHDVLVAHNRVADCAFSAIRANGASNVQVVANRCLRSGETAIYAEFGFEGAVIASNVVDGAAIGISIANLDEGGRMAVCQGNIVRNLVDRAPYEAFEAVGFGIGISVEADTTVTGNIVENAPRFGMMLGWGPFLRNVVATGNVIRAAGEGIAVSVVEGTGPAIITDNVIDATGRAVTGYRWAEAATGELVHGAGDEHPGLTIERNRRG